MISSFLAIHRNPKTFESPDTFKPERWNEPSKAALDSLMPFALGRRNCIGHPMAQVMMEKFIARFVQSYSFALESEDGTENIFIWKPKGVLLSACVVSTHGAID